MEILLLLIEDFEGIEEEVREIVNLLGRVPLAIDFVGAYIFRTQVNPRKFLVTLNEHRSKILRDIPRDALPRYGKMYIHRGTRLLTT